MKNKNAHQTRRDTSWKEMDGQYTVPFDSIISQQFPCKSETYNQFNRIE
jgi:hypothetical protein